MIIDFWFVDAGALEQAKNCLWEAEAFCLMADNHKGYWMPVWGVCVYKDKISPSWVGFDIACWNKAVKTNLKYEDIKDRLVEFADTIFSTLSFGIGRKNDTPVIHSLFEDKVWDEVDFLKETPELKKKAQSQLGTIGSGNHYIDVFRDEEDTIWIGVHFGSRWLWHTIASHFMKLAWDNVNIMDETPHCLDVNTKNWQDYLRCMELAGQYAYAGRDWVCEIVAGIIGAEIIEEVHNHHNFAWLENGYWVVRKGATPAFPWQKGFVWGSMGDNAVIIEWVDSEKSKQAFYSTVHWAGRVMSRTQAAGKTRFKKVERIKPDGTTYMFKETTHEKWLVDFDSVQKELVNKNIILRWGGADEAPEVYKRLPDVLEAHKGTIQVLHTLTPIIVCMAWKEEYDPYKD